MRLPPYLVRLLSAAAAAGWALAWFAALVAVAAPWRRLGGLVDERLRWLERAVLLACLWLGYCAARRRTGLRALFGPAAIAGSVAILGLRLAGRHDAIGIALTAMAAWAAGAWTGRADAVRERCARWLGGGGQVPFRESGTG